MDIIRCNTSLKEIRFKLVVSWTKYYEESVVNGSDIMYRMKRLVKHVVRLQGKDGYCTVPQVLFSLKNRTANKDNRVPEYVWKILKIIIGISEEIQGEKFYSLLVL